MIIYHQDNVAAFAGAHTYYWLPRQLILGRVSVTSAAVAAVLISQARASARFVFARVSGRVN